MMMKKKKKNLKKIRRKPVQFIENDYKKRESPNLDIFLLACVKALCKSFFILSSVSTNLEPVSSTMVFFGFNKDHLLEQLAVFCIWSLNGFFFLEIIISLF